MVPRALRPAVHPWMAGPLSVLLLGARYGRDSAYPGATQGEIYREALRAEALLLSPQGITP